MVCLSTSSLFSQSINQTNQIGQIDSVNQTNPNQANQAIQFDNDKSAYIFQLNENIFPSALRKVKRAVKNAENMNADYLIMELNTYGGAVDIADSIRNLFLKTPVTTVVLINHNAASAGALISISCDSIYMVSGAQFGAASVVNQSGEKMPEKYQSYMRATMRATAENQNRDPLMAEAMVAERIVVPGVVDSISILTFTTSEAIKHNYCEGQFDSVDDLTKYLLVDPSKIEKQEASSIDSWMDFLLNPVFHGALLTIIFAGVYFELQSPGIGFPILAATIAAILYFLPNYLEGLAANWEIFLFIVGLLLLFVELFVLPGFGVAGILGIVAMIVGLALSLVENNFFDFSYTPEGDLSQAFTVVALSFITSIGLMFLVGGSLFNSAYFNRMALDTTQDASAGYTIKQEGSDMVVGKKGLAVTDLKISGRIEVDNERYDAITKGEFITEGTPIVVKENRGNYFVVQKA